MAVVSENSLTRSRALSALKHLHWQSIVAVKSRMASDGNFIQVSKLYFKGFVHGFINQPLRHAGWEKKVLECGWAKLD